MGEALYNHLLSGNDRIACRIYAPVGGYRDLLAYLVRRLLENGANSSFVAMAGDKNVPIKALLERPATKLQLDVGASTRNGKIPMPLDLYGKRKNSAGLEFGHRQTLAKLQANVGKGAGSIKAEPLIPGVVLKGSEVPVVSPSDHTKTVGTVHNATAADVDKAFAVGAKGFKAWSRKPVEDRAAALERMADLLESNRDRLLALLAAEGGKTLDDGIAEIREAVDFCRYYAEDAGTDRRGQSLPLARSRRLFQHLALEFPACHLPGTGFCSAGVRQCRHRQARAPDAADRL
jgi:RHH-type proline utilization regulon transcriptional repressor/proline dehydrogenase/delta 1-pyrroline-5-carboxylate dehydrogenase